MLMRTDPFRSLDRAAEELLGRPTRPAAPPLDAYREGEACTVQFDLPGVPADSIELTVEDNVLTLRAQRDRASTDGREWIVSERPHGSFSRQLLLGETLDAARIEASYRDGVLTLRIPVSEHARPRKVAISAERRVPASIGA